MCMCIRFLSKIKAVEGSGSEGASKYMGEGVTYGSHFILFWQDASSDVPLVSRM